MVNGEFIDAAAGEDNLDRQVGEGFALADAEAFIGFESAIGGGIRVPAR